MRLNSGTSAKFISEINYEKFAHELSFKTSRSSGSGGQNVNKVETRKQ